MSSIYARTLKYDFYYGMAFLSTQTFPLVARELMQCREYSGEKSKAAGIDPTAFE